MSHHHHAHAHSHALGKTLILTIIINIVITVLQAIGGLLSGSLALLSDALHNFSDILSLLVTYIAHKVSHKKADFSKTFGYRRAEIVAAFVNAGSLILIALFLIKEAIFRFFESAPMIQSQWVIWLAILSILGNSLCVLLLHKESQDNLNVRSSYLHLLSDVMSSIAVLIGGLLIYFYQLTWVDSLLTLLIAAYLIHVGYGLFSSSLKILMLFSPPGIAIEEIVKALMKEVPEIKNMHHIHLWQLNEDNIHLEAHLDLKDDMSISDFDQLVLQIEGILSQKYGIQHVTLQPEFAAKDSKKLIA